jgi:hypothetical protein
MQAKPCVLWTTPACLIACLSVACATMPPPQDRLIASQSAIKAAEEVGANSVPAAALHLQLAREQTEQAEKFIAQGANHRAEFSLLRADADAELALALAREAPARARAQEAVDRVQSLKLKNGQ